MGTALAILGAIWQFVRSPVGKWVALAAAIGLVFLVGRCALHNYQDRLREEGRARYEQKQKEKQDETIRKGDDARRDSGTDSDRDKRLRDKYRRD